MTNSNDTSKHSGLKFRIGVVLLILNVPIACGGLAATATLAIATKQKFWLAIGGGIYALSWVMLGAGLWMAGPAGLKYVKGLRGRSLKKAAKKNTDGRARNLVSRMTLDEKITLLGGSGQDMKNGMIGNTLPIDRLGIPSFKMTDATLGSKLTRNATLFPSFIGLAATFNRDLSAAYGRSVAEQARADGFTVLLGPGVNHYRVPNNGRNFEYLGEDPHLASELVVPYIRAVQDTHVVATIKHFVANNSDHMRRNSDSIVSERALNEIYYPAFRAAIDKGNVLALMTSYNLMNGESAGQNKSLITDTLRKQWGFDGLVMTDWEAVNDSRKTALCGSDLEMPKAEYVTAQVIRDLLDEGVITESFLDERVTHILRPFLQLGLLDQDHADPSMRKKWSMHADVAREIARQSIVLLKNEDILPLQENLRTVALIGSNARNTKPSGGGAAGFDPGKDFVTYEAAITSEAEKHGASVVYSEQPDREVERSDIAIVFVTMLETEGMDRPFALPTEEVERIKKTSKLNSNTVVVASLGAGVEMASWIDGVKGLIYAWHPGTYGAVALSEILFGLSPSGKLPISIERKPADAHYHGNYLPEGVALSGKFEGFSKRVPNFEVAYREGVLTGYRWYDSKNIEPMFPFGFGLSYTTFEYSDLELSSGTTRAGGTIELSFTVQNSGKTSGKEGIQMYVADRSSSELRPEKELKGFCQVELAPGESQDVQMSLSPDDLAFWSDATQDWIVEEGLFDVLIGSSSRDIRLKASFSYSDG